MRISTVALWSLALWSSANWANPAHASTEPDSPDAPPLPSDLSDNPAALPFVTLDTLPSELEQAIALDSPVVQQEVIEWSPSLESPTFVNTPELSTQDDVRDGAAFSAEEQAVASLDAIASATPGIAAVDPVVEWSASSAVRDTDSVALAGTAVDQVAVRWDVVDLTPEGEDLWDVQEMTTAQSFQAVSGLDRVNEGDETQTLTEATASPNVGGNSPESSFAVELERDWPYFTPASTNILNVAQISRAPFPDISTHWARGFIEPLAENGVVEGFPDGTFQPDATLTRAEFAALLDQSFVLAPSRSSPNFLDVPESHWANDAIDSAYRSGFISGQSSTRFAPEQALTRADTLTALANGLSLTTTDPAPQLSTYFDDAVQIPSYARNAIAAALDHGMVVNYPQARQFRPNDATTRAEAAAFLHQALTHLDAIPALDPNGLVAQYIVLPDTSTVVVEPPAGRLLTEAEIDDVRQSLMGVLDSLETDQLGSLRTSSPAISISNPTGFGADNFTGFANFSYQSRTRFANEDDATAGLGIGFGDAQENVGFQLSYTVASFGGSRDFGSGGFNAKLHRKLPGRWGVALGWEGFLNIGGDNDFEDTIYGSVSKVIETREDVRDPLSRIALSAGLGNGRFRTEEDFEDDNDTVSPFGSMAILLAPPITSIVEWTGQDLAAGLSIAPFRDFPLVITPAVRDITGAGDGARFIISSGISWQF